VSHVTRALVLRPLMPGDAESMRDLVDAHFSGTPYLVRLAEQLETALGFEDPEYMAILAVDADESVHAVALFGAVAGARQCVKLHAIVSDDPGAIDLLAQGISDVCAHSGERLIVCELPDDAPFGALAEALLGGGFAEEGRVADYVRDGVALRILTRRI
jgi:hypothetical protein